MSEEAADSDWIIGGEVPAVDTTAIANAIDRNTESRVKKSYIGFIIAGLVCAITVAVALVIFITAAAERKRDRKKRRGDGIFPTDDFL